MCAQLATGTSVVPFIEGPTNADDKENGKENGCNHITIYATFCIFALLSDKYKSV